MRRIVNLLVFKIGLDVVASLEMEKQTFVDAERLKSILAAEYEVCPEEVDVVFEQKEIREPMSDLFIACTGKLCFYNDMWNVEIVNGFSVVDWLDLNTEEGINTLSDYKFIGKVDELIKFN